MADMSKTNQESTEKQAPEKQEPSLVSHMYRYRVTTFQIDTKDDPAYKEENYRINLNPACVKTIELIQIFDNGDKPCLQPIMHMKAVLPPPVVDYINLNVNKISFILRIDMVDFLGGFQNQLAGAGEEDYAENGVETLCDDKFITIVSDTMKTPNLDEYRSVSDIMEARERAGDTTNLLEAGHNFANYTSEFEMDLWKENDLYALRKQINAVYSSFTVGDAAMSLLSDNGFKRVLIAKSTNNERFGQLIIPPMAMMNSMRFLQNQYGMYNTDITFFADIWRTYVIDKSGECKAYEENEFTKTIFTVVPTRSEYSQDSCTSNLDEKKEYHMLVDIRKVATRSKSSVNDVLQGNNNMYIDARNNEVTTVKGAGEQRGEGCVNVTTDNEGSAYTKMRQANEISELAMNLRIVNITEYNYGALSPNKAFIFNFKDKDFYIYNGYYRLMKIIHVLTRIGSGEHMNITCLSAEFTRKKALSEDERKTIDYDVFRTAQVTEEGKKEAEQNGADNKTKDPSYQQSQDNKVEEGKMDAPAKENTGSPAPGTMDDVSKKPEGVPALTEQDKGNLDRLAEQPSKTQTVNPDTDPGYQKQENERKQQKSREPSNVGGSKPPTPLDKKI